jgi:hypothetical protein
MKRAGGGGSERVEDFEPRDLACMQAEDVDEGFVRKAVGLTFEAAALRVADGLLHFDEDCAVGLLGEAEGLDAGADDGPLAGPVVADGFTAVKVAAVHAVGPGYVLGERGEESVDVPGVEVGVKVSQEGDVGVHGVLLQAWRGSRWVWSGVA